jgi:hypothetical protein
MTSTTLRISKHIIVILEGMDEHTEQEFKTAFIAEGLTGYEPPPAKLGKPGKRGKLG